MEIAVRAANWRRWLSLAAGVVGLLLILATPFVSLSTGKFDHWSQSALVAGLAMIIYFIYENRVRVAGMLGGRVAKYGTNTTVMIILFAVIVLFINLLGALNVQRWDLTANKAYTLSPQTLTVLSRIPSTPVQISVFLPGLDQKGPVEDVLKEYTRQSDKVIYKFVDMMREPGLAAQYKVQQPTIVVEHEGTRKDVFSTEEQPLTSAILTVITKKPKKVYWVTGHRELDMNNSDATGGGLLKEILTNDAYAVEPLNLAVVDKIPPDASVVLLAGPKDNLPEEQYWLLEFYISYGGKVLILTDPGKQETLGNMLVRWGLEAGKGTVVDAESPFLNDPLTPVVSRYPFSLITKDLGATVFPSTTSISVTKNLPAWIQAQPIIFSSGRSWLKTNPGTGQLNREELGFEEGKDVRGPLPIAAVVMGQLELGAEQKTRMVVVGNSEFATNRYLATFAGNRDFLANSINWLAEEEELITIRANPPEMRNLVLDPISNLLLMGSSVVGLPLLVLIAGGIVWWVRR